MSCHGSRWSHVEGQTCWGIKIWHRLPRQEEKRWRLALYGSRYARSKGTTAKLVITWPYFFVASSNSSRYNNSSTWATRTSLTAHFQTIKRQRSVLLAAVEGSKLLFSQKKKIKSKKHYHARPSEQWAYRQPSLNRRNLRADVGMSKGPFLLSFLLFSTSTLFLFFSLLFFTRIK